ncbi:TasA family protein [Neobacillus sp. YIM B06451]|uniref:TasA family protein n=1 Tax=Neobacillus sp. YIM B06451 TaxID=3070994 RepID=UPI0029301352|nr:TasA family protein [Neobacillus sp. YIM B06451]
MSFKKRLTLGALSATLGLSLLVGGTWAAFNDIENLNGKVAAGTFSLNLQDAADKGPKSFTISNLKPGDKMTRTIKLVNDGTIAIKDVLLSIENVNFIDYVPTEGQAGFGDTDVYGENNVLQYLDQFKVTVVNVGAEGGSGWPIDIIGKDGEEGPAITLKDLYVQTAKTKPADASNGDITSAENKFKNTQFVREGYFIDGRLNVAPLAKDYKTKEEKDKYAGVPATAPGNWHEVQITIEFKDEDKKDSRGVYEQNKFQGDKADVKFTFEARQWDGQVVTEDGPVESNKKPNNGKGF